MAVVYDREKNESVVITTILRISYKKTCIARYAGLFLYAKLNRIVRVFPFTQDENRVIFRKDRLRRDFSRKLFAFLEGQDIDMVVLRIFRSPTVLPIQAWGMATSQTA